MVSQSPMLCVCFALLSSVITPIIAESQQLLRSAGRNQHETPASKGNGSGRRLLVDCGDPQEVQYAAEIHLMTYVEAVSCTSVETAYIGERIRQHWVNYINFNPNFGLIQLEINGDVCASTNRRLVQRNQTSSLAHGRELSLANWLFRIGNGNCLFCWPDDGDDGRRRRRLSTTVPITFQFHTDNNPDEMWFKIKDSNGFEVAKQYELLGAQPNSNYTVTYDFIPGETYSFYKKDRFGDGWCCGHGHGGVKVFDGVPATGMDLIDTFNGDFNKHQVETFTVPAVGVADRSAGYDNPADVLFPTLETGLSNYISFYIQQEFHNDAASCLYNANPAVWIDLEEASSEPLSC